MAQVLAIAGERTVVSTETPSTHVLWNILFTKLFPLSIIKESQLRHLDADEMR